MGDLTDITWLAGTAQVVSVQATYTAAFNELAALSPVRSGTPAISVWTPRPVTRMAGPVSTRSSAIGQAGDLIGGVIFRRVTS